jgi:RecB family exonuclease
MTQPTVIRASSLSDFADCPRRWAARNLTMELLIAGYVIRELPKSIAAVIGTAVHAGAAFALGEKATSGVLPSVDTTTDVVRESLREEIAKGAVFDDEIPVAHAAGAATTRMTRAFHAVIAPQINPVLVERRLEADVAPGVVLSGKADSIAHEPDAIIDLKTGKRRGNHKPQFGAYSLLRRTFGGDITHGREAFILRTKKEPQPMPLLIDHDIEQCESSAMNIVGHIRRALEIFRHGTNTMGGGSIHAGDPWAFAANPNSMLCSPKFCPAWGTKFCTEHMTKET